MDFAWNTEQREYKTAAIRFAQKELSQGVTEREQQESFARDLCPMFIPRSSHVCLLPW